DGGVVGGSGSGGGPAPFLVKTYEMVDDSTTDDIVSWSGSRKSFVVWNPPEFARLLLPSYFKHSNFSSFIRQLNTYGFKKIDPERWEFANEDFVQGQKHLLKHIHRRKPIHSHSAVSSVVDPERVAFHEEIDKLSKQKTVLQGNLARYKESQSTARLQLETLNQRISFMEQKQEHLLSFLEKAVQNPGFVEQLTQKLESMEFLVYNKKRRIPQADDPPQQDLCNTLTLELSDSGSDINNNEDGRAAPSDSGASFNLHSVESQESDEEEEDDRVSCLLNLTLASSSVEPTKTHNPMESSSPPPPPPPLRVNDVFWEQFLTERPGGSDNEEAYS
ncbi:hypothetical protein M569_02138, partial [Genlisea aurea]